MFPGKLVGSLPWEQQRGDAARPGQESSLSSTLVLSLQMQIRIKGDNKRQDDVNFC